MKDYGNVLLVTVLSNGEFQSSRESLARNIARRMGSHQPVDLNQLSKSTAIRKMVHFAKRLHRMGGGDVWWQRSYETEARQLLAEHIIGEANERIKNNLN